MSGEGTPSPGGTPPGVAADQSMEDILASIRRILNEDDVALPAAGDAQAPPSTDAPPDPAEPLLLTEDMMVPEPEDAVPPAVVPDMVAEPPMPVPVAAAEPPAPEGLLAPAVAAAAAASVGQLMRAVSTERGAMVHRGGPSIEDVVREEIRPLLKDWLDQHLPGIVERLVRAEIERVVGGDRS
jgi:cell pole-organizing protein PopZ